MLLHKKSGYLFTGAHQLANQLKKKLGDRVLGPEFTIIPRINTYYQQQILLKLENKLSMVKVKEFIKNTIEIWAKEDYSKSIRVKIDIDPM